MAICGACPGTVLGQLGSGLVPAVFVFVGGLCGALTYGLVDDLLDLPKRIFGTSNTPAGFFVDAWFARRFSFISYPLVCFLFGVLGVDACVLFLLGGWFICVRVGWFGGTDRIPVAICTTSDNTYRQRVYVCLLVANCWWCACW